MVHYSMNTQATLHRIRAPFWCGERHGAFAKASWRLPHRLLPVGLSLEILRAIHLCTHVARQSTICYRTATGKSFPRAVRRRGALRATHRTSSRRGSTRSGTGNAPQRRPTWRHPPGGGQRPPVMDATADAPRPPQPPHDREHFSTSSSRPGPPPRDGASNAAAVQRGPPRSGPAT